jgi:5-methylcytosine-specific restriction endonuclease McrA
MTYGEKLKSPKWQKKRLEILERDKFTCTNCGSKEKQLHVHHKVYIFNNEPWDYENEFFTTLCYGCHETEEQYKFFVNQNIRYNIYKGLTYKKLHEELSVIFRKYAEDNNLDIIENLNFYNYA